MLRHLTLSPASCMFPACFVTPLSVPGMRRIDPRYWIMINPVRSWNTMHVSVCSVQLMRFTFGVWSQAVLWISGCFSTCSRAVAEEDLTFPCCLMKSGEGNQTERRPYICEWSVGKLVCFYLLGPFSRSAPVILSLWRWCCTVVSADLRVSCMRL